VLKRNRANVDAQRVAPLNDRHPAGNPLIRPAPRAVAVEVDPRVELCPRRRILHVDRDRDAKLPDAELPERHAVFVVPVAIRRGRRLPVGFSIAAGPQRGANVFMPGPVAGQQRRVRRGRVAKVRG
jgi:hypothetical protein